MPEHRRSPRLGIAITTFERCDALEEQLALLADFTSEPFDLVVSDDGSTDDTLAMLEGRGVATVTGRNRGVAWNKNRGIFHLLHRTTAEIILLLDDDVVPTIHGWEQEWIAATEAFGHVNFMPPHLREHLITGRCRAADPGISTMVGGQCMGVARRALAAVGFFDPRFGQYGHEHADFSFRCARAGFGGVKRPYGQAECFLLAIEGGIALRDMPSHSDPDCLRRNLALLFELEHAPVHRPPWRSDGEMQEFRSEFAWAGASDAPLLRTAARFDPASYLANNPDVARAGGDPFLHYLCYGRREGRRVE